MSTRSLRDTQACASSVPAAVRRTPIVRFNGPSFESSSSSATSARIKHVLRRPSRRPVASIAQMICSSESWTRNRPNRRKRPVPARIACSGMTRNAAATTTCAMATAPSSRQSAGDRTVRPLAARTIGRMTESREADVCLWFALVLPSSFVADKYLGWTGTLAYAIVAAVIVTLRPRLSPRLSNRDASWLAVFTLAFIIVVFLVVYPIANTHVAGAGSDDDDTLNLGALALISGHSPYSRTTYLGNVLHHLPGAFVLASPFVLLGSSALQNLFWLPMFFLAVRRDADGRSALELAWLVLGLSPGVMYEVVTGTEYMSNTIYVLLGLWWLVRTTHRDIAAIAWGLTLASRANFLFLVPLAFGSLRQHAGLRTALRTMAFTCATIACLTVPFYLHDRRNFGPLDAANRVLVFNALLPHLG